MQHRVTLIRLPAWTQDVLLALFITGGGFAVTARLPLVPTGAAGV
jgi:hypothetical protein